MTSVTQVTLTCDVCGKAKDVKTRAFEVDGAAYEIDLCRKDSDALGRIAGGYIAKARKITARPEKRRRGGSPRPSPSDQKGIYVYGILPADIEVADGIPGVGEHSGPLRAVRLNGLAALISEADLSVSLGSPEDLRTYQEILDATAAEVPILPLRFGTVLTSEDAVTEKLLAANHDEFTATLGRLEGHAEFQVKGRYGGEAAARRDEDTRALMQAMEGVSVACAVPEPASEPDCVHVAFLVAADQERQVERVVEDMAREWEGRIEVQLLGPMAAYDFAGTAQRDI